jgi:hypothetical protein
MKIIAQTARQDVGAAAAKKQVIARIAAQAVIAKIAEDVVISLLDAQAIIAIAALRRVITRAGEDDIMARPHGRLIVARAKIRVIGGRRPGEIVIAAPHEPGQVVGIGGDSVIPVAKPVGAAVILIVIKTVVCGTGTGAVLVRGQAGAKGPNEEEKVDEGGDVHSGTCEEARSMRSLAWDCGPSWAQSRSLPGSVPEGMGARGHPRQIWARRFGRIRARGLGGRAQAL